jgi:uncharacterized repeat protein (TIGR03803 family)
MRAGVAEENSMKQLKQGSNRCALLGLLASAALMSAIFASYASAVSVQETVLYNFSNCGTGGCGPFGALVEDSAGNLYGTTSSGGNLACQGNGCGTVFELTPNGSGGWTETILYAFSGGSDGMDPYNGVIFDAAGNLYGTTSLGGGGGPDCQYGSGGCGTVFKLTQSGGIWSETVLYRFTGGADGSLPNSALVADKSGNLYGVTGQGGLQNGCYGQGCGTVFEISPSSSGWAESVIYTFQSMEGAYAPYSTLVFDDLGDLYGTANGGVYDAGVVFRLARSPGVWTESNIWSFGGGYDGAQASGVIFHDGDLYGTTQGGLYDVGNVFQLTPAVGNWKMRVIYSFTGGNDGGFPLTALTASPKYLFGTTEFGGTFQDGTVFALVPGENGQWAETVLYNFTGGSDGANPYSPLLISSGNLDGFAYSDTNPYIGEVFQISRN